MSMENDEESDTQDKSHHHQGTRKYCKVITDNRLLALDLDHDHDNSNNDDQGLMRTRPPHDHSNKHSYFLRTKTPRFLGFHDEDGKFKKPSPPVSSNRVGCIDNRERPPSSSSPLLLSSCSKSDHYPASLTEEEDLANCLVMLSSKPQAISSDDNNNKKENKHNSLIKEVVEKGTFQCKACKKVFNSHQALGGHRASHKKVKGCFASKLESLNEDHENNSTSQDSVQEEQEVAPPPLELDSAKLQPSSTLGKRTKMHECSVCRRIFSSGQALGGHKRCHWLTSSSDNAFLPSFHDFQYQQLCKKTIFTKPLHHEDHDQDQDNQHLSKNTIYTKPLHHQDHNYVPVQTDDQDHQLDLNLNLPPPPQQDQKKLNDDVDKSSTCEASTKLCLQQCTYENQSRTQNDIVSGEEGYCGMKLRKLSDLRDVNFDGEWLQMGIPSTTQMREKDLHQGGSSSQYLPQARGEISNTTSGDSRISVTFDPGPKT